MFALAARNGKKKSKKSTADQDDLFFFKYRKATSSCGYRRHMSREIM